MTEEMIVVPKRVLELVHPEGFIQMYLEKLQTCDTAKAAYDATNAIHEKYFGKPKYSSYYSFNNIQRRLHRQKK